MGDENFVKIFAINGRGGEPRRKALSNFMDLSSFVLLISIEERHPRRRCFICRRNIWHMVDQLCSLLHRSAPTEIDVKLPFTVRSTWQGRMQDGMNWQLCDTLSEKTRLFASGIGEVAESVGVGVSVNV